MIEDEDGEERSDDMTAPVNYMASAAVPKRLTIEGERPFRSPYKASYPT